MRTLALTLTRSPDPNPIPGPDPNPNSTPNPAPDPNPNPNPNPNQAQLLQQEVQQGQQAEAIANPPPARGRRLLFNSAIPPVGPVFGLLGAAVAALPPSQHAAAERFVPPGASSLFSPERSAVAERGAREESAPGGLPAPPASAASLLSLAESSRPPTLAANAARASKVGHARAPRFDYLRKLSAVKPPKAAAPVRLLAGRGVTDDLAAEEARVKAELARADQVRPQP